MKLNTNWYSDPSHTTGKSYRYSEGNFPIWSGYFTVYALKKTSSLKQQFSSGAYDDTATTAFTWTPGYSSDITDFEIMYAKTGYPSNTEEVPLENEFDNSVI